MSSENPARPPSAGWGAPIMAATWDDSESALQSYLDDVDQVASEPLSREREVELAARIQQGDLQARNELAQANLRFCHFRSHEVPAPGLIIA